VYLYNLLFHRVVCIAGGNKMALCCIGLVYNAEWYIYIATDVGGWQLAGMELYQEMAFEIT
jgi:hypothetical protein